MRINDGLCEKTGCLHRIAIVQDENDHICFLNLVSSLSSAEVKDDCGKNVPDDCPFLTEMVMFDA
jgi:hypothetical protein